MILPRGAWPTALLAATLLTTCIAGGARAAERVLRYFNERCAGIDIFLVDRALERKVPVFRGRKGRVAYTPNKSVQYWCGRVREDRYCPGGTLWVEFDGHLNSDVFQLRCISGSPGPGRP